MSEKRVDHYKAMGSGAEPKSIAGRRLSTSTKRIYGINDFLALIDRRKLERECLTRALNVHRIGMRVVAFEDLAALQQAQESLGAPRAVLFNGGGSTTGNDDHLETEIAEVVAAVAPAAVVVLSEDQNLSNVLRIIALGVRGYIPSSVGIDVCIEAIALAIAGGKFIPASSVMHMRRALDVMPTAEAETNPTFTERQAAVADALRRGKANKDIALELDLSESTVKVHIRSIMKKLGATNRTQVAYKICGTAHPTTTTADS